MYICSNKRVVYVKWLLNMINSTFILHKHFIFHQKDFIRKHKRWAQENSCVIWWSLLTKYLYKIKMSLVIFIFCMKIVNMSSTSRNFWQIFFKFVTNISFYNPLDLMFGQKNPITFTPVRLWFMGPEKCFF